jgi:hypothetical protein
MTLVAEKNAMNAFAADIDPKERAALIIVNHAFADDVSGPDEKRRSHALRSSSIQSPAPEASHRPTNPFTTMKT